MYSSVAPEPEVPWVQAGLLDVEVAKVTSEGRAGVCVAMLIEVGYADTPEIPLWASHSTVYELAVPPGDELNVVDDPPEAGSTQFMVALPTVTVRVPEVTDP